MPPLVLTRVKGAKPHVIASHATIAHRRRGIDRRDGIRQTVFKWSAGRRRSRADTTGKGGKTPRSSLFTAASDKLDFVFEKTMGWRSAERELAAQGSLFSGRPPFQLSFLGAAGRSRFRLSAVRTSSGRLSTWNSRPPPLRAVEIPSYRAPPSPGVLWLKSGFPELRAALRFVRLCELKTIVQPSLSPFRLDSAFRAGGRTEPSCAKRRSKAARCKVPR